MRVINRLFAAFVAIATLAIAGCEKPAPLPNDVTIAVTYSAIDGCWQLTKWQGKPLANDTYLYVEFDRSEHRYTMWDNINSMYGIDTTGTFSITEQEDGSYTLSGTYDYGVGDWSNDYTISLHDEGNTMLWLAPEVNMEFERIAEIPELN